MFCAKSRAENKHIKIARNRQGAKARNGAPSGTAGAGGLIARVMRVRAGMRADLEGTV